MEDYESIALIMGYIPDSDGEYNAGDMIEMHIIMQEIEQATIAVLRKFGADI